MGLANDDTKKVSLFEFHNDVINLNVKILKTTSNDGFLLSDGRLTKIVQSGDTLSSQMREIVWLTCNAQSYHKKACQFVIKTGRNSINRLNVRNDALS